MKLPISNLIVSHSIFIIIYIYIIFVDLNVSRDMQYRLLFFFWRYNISLMSWNCQSQIWLCLSFNLHFHIYIYINLFCCFECISWYEISSSSFGDIIFHWYLQIANLVFDLIFLNLHIYKYFFFLSCALWMYLILWNIIFIFWRYNISLISWNYQIHIWFCLSQSTYIYIDIYQFLFLNISHEIKYRLLLLAI